MNLWLKKDTNCITISQTSIMNRNSSLKKNGQAVPIEVKAENSSTVSLNGFIEKYEPDISYKLIQGNLGTADGKISLPHYMIIFL